MKKWDKWKKWKNKENINEKMKKKEIIKMKKK
jgi:hypothetical protein